MWDERHGCTYLGVEKIARHAVSDGVQVQSEGHAGDLRVLRVGNPGYSTSMGQSITEFANAPAQVGKKQLAVLT